MNIVFTGTTAVQQLWLNQDIPVSTMNPPDPLALGNNGGSILLYTPDSEFIRWDTPAMGTLPQILNGQTVQSISQIPAFSDAVINRRVLLQMSSGVSCNFYDQFGTPILTSGQAPAINVSLSSISQVLYSQTIESASAGGENYCSDTSCPRFIYDAPTDLSVKIRQVAVIPYKSNFRVTARDVCRFSMTGQMSITMTITCDSSNLLNELSFCNIYCISSQDNIRACQDDYSAICLAPVSPTPDILLTKNKPCQSFFERYYIEFGPDDAGLESRLTSYCRTKYGSVGFAELFENLDNLFDQRLCACRMDESWYNEFAESLRGFNPNFISYIDVTGVNQRCLVSQCAASVFTTAQIADENTFTCKIPACVNVVNFTNRGGTFDSVTIKQEQTCQEINNGNNPPPNPNPNPPGPNPPGPKPPGPNPQPTSSWLSRNWWWILIITVALLLIFIIIIVAVVRRRKTKSS